MNLLKMQVQFFESFFVNALSRIRKRVQFFGSYQRKVQFFESCWKEQFKCVNHVQKGFNSSSHIEKKLNPLSHIENRFNSSSRIQKKYSTLCLSRVQKVFNSLRNISKKFKSLSHISIKLKSLSHISTYFQKKTDSMCHIQKKKGSILWGVSNKIFESFWKKSSINSLNHQKMFLYFDWYFSENQFIESSFLQKGLILWDISKRKFKSSSHIEKKKRFNSLSQVQQKVQFFESCSKKKKQFFQSWSTKSSIFRVMFRKSSILWVKKIMKIFQFFESYPKKGFNSLSHVKKTFNFYESCWNEGVNSVNHMEKIQFCESCFFKKSLSQKKSLFLFDIFWENHSSSHLFSKKGWILWRISKRKFKSSSHLLKKFQFFEFCESCFIRKQWILWVIIQKSFCESYWKRGFNSSSPIFPKRSIYSLSHTFCEIGIFFESY